MAACQLPIMMLISGTDLGGRGVAPIRLMGCVYTSHEICAGVFCCTAFVFAHLSLQFDYGHMDFTFSAKEELGWYVMSLLMRT